MTALLSMYEKWVKAASMAQLSGVVLVDLSAAFDLVSPSLLIQKLKIYGFDDSTRQWILTYLTDRYQSVWIDHVLSEFEEISIGVPQGSNLGPLFFLIFFNDLPTFISGSIDCYADDSTLGATGKDIVDIGNKELPYVPVKSIADDIVVNMDGGVGGSWKVDSVPLLEENDGEIFSP